MYAVNRSKRKTWAEAEAQATPFANVPFHRSPLATTKNSVLYSWKRLEIKKISKPLEFCQVVCPRQPFFSRLEPWEPLVGSAARLVDAASSRTPHQAPVLFKSYLSYFLLLPPHLSDLCNFLLESHEHHRPGNVLFHRVQMYRLSKKEAGIFPLIILESVKKELPFLPTMALFYFI